MMTGTKETEITMESLMEELQTEAYDWGLNPMFVGTLPETEEVFLVEPRTKSLQTITNTWLSEEIKALRKKGFNTELVISKNGSFYFIGDNDLDGLFNLLDEDDDPAVEYIKYTNGKKSKMKSAPTSEICGALIFDIC